MAYIISLQSKRENELGKVEIASLFDMQCTTVSLNIRAMYDL